MSEVRGSNEDILMRFTPFGIKTEYKTGDGVMKYKDISLPTLKRILTEDAQVDTGFFNLYGKGYIGVKRYIQSGDRDILFIEASPSVRKITYYGTVYEIPFPGLLMMAVGRTDKSGRTSILRTKLYATQAPMMRENDRLYQFPFANVYTGSGAEICWGQVNLSPFNTVQKMSGLMQAFISEDMNSDLYQPPQNECDLSLDSYLNKLQGKNSFPYENLRDLISFKELLSVSKSKNL